MRLRRLTSCTRMRARKGVSMRIRRTRPAAGRIRRGGMAAGRPIGCRLSGWSDARVARSAYRSVPTVIAPPCSHLSRPTPGQGRPSIRMSGRHTPRPYAPAAGTAATTSGRGTRNLWSTRTGSCYGGLYGEQLLDQRVLGSREVMFDCKKRKHHATKDGIRQSGSRRLQNDACAGELPERLWPGTSAA